MRQRIGAYRYDFLRQAFYPLSTEALDVAEREVPGLVEGLVEMVEQLERDGATVPPKTRAAAMTQATDLGQIANIPGASYRARVNANLQGLASWHYGPAAPDPTFPNMFWFDQGEGKVWLRDAANTAWAEVAAIGPPFAWTALDIPAVGFATGDVKATLRTAADSGWVMMDDGSIGSAASGATSRANSDCRDLFLLLWANISNTWAPLQNASGTPIGRGASAAADWASNCRLVLPRMLGRSLAAAGWGAGLSERVLGEAVGEETHLLDVDELPAHNHSGSTNTTGAHQHVISVWCTNGVAGSIGTPIAGQPGLNGQTMFQVNAAGNHSHTISSQGGGQAHNVMQPTAFLNFEVKL
jgi:microcystin-dependent protein